MCIRDRWKDIKLLDCNNYHFYFQTAIGDLIFLNNILRCYTGGTGNYVVAVGDKYYIGGGDNEKVYFFAEFSSLKEACEAL